LVGLDAETTRLDGQQGIRAEGLLQEERLVVDQPIHQRCRTLGAEFVTDRLDCLEGVEDIQFVSEDSVFQPAKPEEGLRTEALAGYDFLAQPLSVDFGARQQIQRARRHGAVVSRRFPSIADSLLEDDNATFREVRFYPRQVGSAITQAPTNPALL